MKQTKLFERLVTKFSIKVNDLAKYMEISKATIYNYRNLEEFGQIPNDKQYKIFYLFGKENEDELMLLLDESDKNLLKSYSDRIDVILNEKTTNVLSSIGVGNNIYFSNVSNLDELSRKAVHDKVCNILFKLSNLEVKGFVDYLDIFDSHIEGKKK